MTTEPHSAIRPWRVISSELVFDNRWARVRRDSCDLGNGVTIPDYFYWQGGDFVQVFALTTSGEVLLTRQYKHGVKEIVIELPAGLIDLTDESPLAAAKRELSEETGYSGGRWTPLGILNVSSAKATTRAFSFLALEVMLVSQQQLDSTEQIECLRVSQDSFMKMIVSGTIHDSSSLATSFLAFNAKEALGAQLGRLK